MRWATPILAANAPVIFPWVQVLLWAGASVLAIGAIWKMIRSFGPMIKALVEIAAVIPVLREMARHIGDDQTPLVLREIASQFRTDGGSSLRDVVNVLETKAHEVSESLAQNKNAVEMLRIETKAANVMDERDRIDTVALVGTLNRLSDRLDATQRELQAARTELVCPLKDQERSAAHGDKE